MLEKPIVRGVTVDKNQARLTAMDLPDVPGIAGKMFGKLAAKNINVDMIVQSSSEHTAGKNDISFTVAKEDLPGAQACLAAVVKEINGGMVKAAADIAKISIVGVGMRAHAGVAAKMFEALAQAECNILMISTSEIKVSCIIEASKVEQATRFVHDAFELGEAGSETPAAAGQGR